MRKQRGFTLIELLIVVAIIGIIAAIAIPNLLTAIQRAKQKRAMGEVRSLATAAQSYATDSQTYPVADSGTTWGDANQVSVNSDLTPDYIKAIPAPDPWGVSYYQYASAAGGVDFGVASYGKDTTADGTFAFTTVSANTFTPVSNTGCFENDIIWVDDSFVVSPGGKQSKCF